MPSLKSVSELSAAPLITLPKPSIKAQNPILFFQTYKALCSR